jgi:hypothetical protein
MWGKYWRIYPEFAKRKKKKTGLYLKYCTTNIRKLIV